MRKLRHLLWLTIALLFFCNTMRAQLPIINTNVGFNVLANNFTPTATAQQFILSFPPNAVSVTFYGITRGSTGTQAPLIGVAQFGTNFNTGQQVNGNTLSCAIPISNLFTYSIMSNLSVPTAVPGMFQVICPIGPNSQMLFQISSTPSVPIDLYAIVSTTPSPLVPVPSAGGIQAGLSASNINPLIIGAADQSGNARAFQLQNNAGSASNAQSLFVKQEAYFAQEVTGTVATPMGGASAKFLHSVTINTPAAGIIKISSLSNASCTGTIAANIASVTVVALSAPVTLTYDAWLAAGICIQATVAMDYTASYSN